MTPSDARFIRHAPHRLRHRRSLSFVLSFFHRTAPAAIAGELDARVRDQRGDARHARRDLLLRLHAAADPGRRARRHDGAAPAPGRRLARRGHGVARVRARADLAGRGGRAHAGRASACRSRSSRSSRSHAVWFPADRFATLNGVTMFAGNAGAVIAGAPLAWLVAQTSWRSVFVGLGAAVARARRSRPWWRVRDRPQDMGFAPVNADVAARARTDRHWIRCAGAGARQSRHVARVLRQRRRRRQLPRVRGLVGGAVSGRGLRHDARDAAEHASLLLLGVALGALAIGWLSDRLGEAGADSCACARCCTRCRGCPGSCT